MRWHDTPISASQSWRFTVGALAHLRQHTIMDYLNILPGRDDVLVARVPWAKFVLVRSPELARHVLVANQDNYAKAPEYDMLAVAFGRGLVTDLDEEQWQRNRRLVQPIFAKRNVDRLAGPMVEATTDAVSRLAGLETDGDPVDINAEMNRLTLDITARTMFGVDITGPMSDVVLRRLLRFFGIGFLSNISRPLHRIGSWAHRASGASRAHNSRLPMRVMRSAGWLLAPRAMRDLRHTEQVVAGIISDHRSGRIVRKDNLLALLMDARDPETGYAYTDQEIRDELMTFIGAGMETTATALSWVWRLLAEHPDVRQRVQDEVRTVLGDRVANADDVPNLPWTQAVIAETMRLLPPVIGVARTAKHADTLGTFRIKPGTVVGVVIHGVHHNTRIWEDPDDFKPSRFLATNLTKVQRLASMPFGAGKRMCVASGLATMEATLVVATIVQDVQLDLVPQPPIRRQLSFTGGPDGPLLMQPRSVRANEVSHDVTPVDRDNADSEALRRE